MKLEVRYSVIPLSGTHSMSGEFGGGGIAKKRLVCGHICVWGGWGSLIDMRAQLTVGSTIPYAVVLGCIRELAECEPVGEPANGITPWSQTNPFFPRVALGQSILSQKEKGS